MHDVGSFQLRQEGSHNTTSPHPHATGPSTTGHLNLHKQKRTATSRDNVLNPTCAVRQARRVLCRPRRTCVASAAPNSSAILRASMTYEGRLSSCYEVWIGIRTSGSALWASRMSTRGLSCIPIWSGQLFARLPS